MNSRKQGDIGTSFAIAYFASQGYTVNIPLSDSQSYDLIIEKDGLCKRVQCKTCFKKNKNGKFRVETRTVSNTRGKELRIKQLKPKDCDLLFIMDGEGYFYILSSFDIVSRNYIYTSKIEEFKVYLKSKFEVGCDTNN